MRTQIMPVRQSYADCLLRWSTALCLEHVTKAIGVDGRHSGNARSWCASCDVWCIEIPLLDNRTVTVLTITPAFVALTFISSLIRQSIDHFCQMSLQPFALKSREIIYRGRAQQPSAVSVSLTCITAYHCPAKCNHMTF
jgi:hypothetical protein